MKKLVATLVLAAGCGAEAPPADTGGATLPEGPCGRGLVVVASDYSSASSVALADTEGKLVSESILSSGSRPPGLGAPLSGDVVVPSARPASGRLVVIDRRPPGVLTWLDVETGAIEGQLALSPGVDTNPYDYLELDARKAYVTRYGSNPAPGAQPFDEGDDLLIVDPSTKKRVARIPLPVEGAILPRPTRLATMGTMVLVSLERLSRSFDLAGDGMVVGVDPRSDTLAWTITLPGLASCGAAIPSRDGSKIAVICSGMFFDGPAGQLARSGVAVLDATTSPPTLRKVVRTTTPPSPFGDLEDDDHLVVMLYGNRDLDLGDRLVRIDLRDDTISSLLDAPAFTLGDVRCLHGCGRCVVADAAAGGLHIVTSTSVSFRPLSSHGLPPRYVGQF